MKTEDYSGWPKTQTQSGGSLKGPDLREILCDEVCRGQNSCTKCVILWKGFSKSQDLLSNKTKAGEVKFTEKIFGIKSERSKFAVMKFFGHIWKASIIKMYSYLWQDRPVLWQHELSTWWCTGLLSWEMNRRNCSWNVENKNTLLGKSTPHPSTLFTYSFNHS